VNAYRMSKCDPDPLFYNYGALILAILNPKYTADKAISYFSPKILDRD